MKKNLFVILALISLCTAAMAQAPEGEPQIPVYPELQKDKSFSMILVPDPQSYAKFAANQPLTMDGRIACPRKIGQPPAIHSGARQPRHWAHHSHRPTHKRTGLHLPRAQHKIREDTRCHLPQLARRTYDGKFGI